MYRLLLLRHAKSDWSAQDLGDHERPLNPRGRAAAPRMGRYMAETGLLPDRVLVSTSTRTRQTWALLAQALPAVPDVSFLDRLYNASAAALLSAIRETGDDVRNLMLVAHNPGLEELAVQLAGSGEDRSEMSQKFPTAALAVIDFDVTSWRSIARGRGHLERFVVPRALHQDSRAD